MTTTVESSAGEKYEKLAFQFCKIATFAVLAQRFTLPLAASLAAVFFIVAHFKGKHTSRCLVRYPLMIAGIWIVVVAGWVFVYLNPGFVRDIAGSLWPQK